MESAAAPRRSPTFQSPWPSRHGILNPARVHLIGLALLRAVRRGRAPRPSGPMIPECPWRV
jgi:hypothetical protein